MKSVDKQCPTDDGQTAGGQQADRLTTVKADKTTMDRPPVDNRQTD